MEKSYFDLQHYLEEEISFDILWLILYKLRAI